MPLLGWIIVFTALGGIASAAFASAFMLLPERTSTRLLPHLVSFATGALLGAALLALLPDAMESDRPLPLIETALERLRSEGIIAPSLIHLPLADLLLEVENWTGFLRHFTHLTSGDAPVGAHKLVLVAALMGMGMDLGLSKMAEVCPYTYRQLS